jgi:DNA-binding NtrC family response regulator
MADRIKVLVVDDERTYRALLDKTLRAEGYEVDLAENGREALHRAANADYDIVLTDLAMPDVGGIDVLKGIKAKRPDTVVIIITGFASLDTALAAIKDGVYDYITKPFQLEEIRLTMKNAVERQRLEREKDTLVAKLEKAYAVIEELSQNRRQYQVKIEEIDRQLANRQSELTEGIRRLRGFHDRVLPDQFAKPPAKKGERKEPQAESPYDRLNKAVQLRKDGTISAEEFRLLKKKILAE